MKHLFWLVALLMMIRPAVALQVGDALPPASATSTAGDVVSLESLKDQWTVLYFYPKSFTPGCTKQACSMRDGYAGFAGLKAVVYGVSVDDLDTQKKFKAEYQLPFELLADEKKEIAKAFDVLGLGNFLAQRKTFIINPEGKLAARIDSIDVTKHDQQVKDELARLQAANPAP